MVSPSPSFGRRQRGMSSRVAQVAGHYPERQKFHSLLVHLFEHALFVSVLQKAFRPLTLWDDFASNGLTILALSDSVLSPSTLLMVYGNHPSQMLSRLISLVRRRLFRGIRSRGIQGHYIRYVHHCMLVDRCWNVCSFPYIPVDIISRDR